MITETIKANDILLNQGQISKSIYIITNGQIRSTYLKEDIILQKGDVIGLFDINYGYSSCTYTAQSDCTLLVYPCKTWQDFQSIVKSNKEMSSLFLRSITSYLCAMADNYILHQYNTDNLYHYLLSSYEEYKNLCRNFSIAAKSLPGIESLEPLLIEDDLKPWLINFYECIQSMDLIKQKNMFTDHPDFLIGYIMKAGDDIHSIFELLQKLEDYQGEISYLFLNSSQLDFFDLYTSLLFRARKTSNDTMSLTAIISKLMIQMEGLTNIDPALFQDRMHHYKKQLKTVEETSAFSKQTLDSASVHTSLTDSLTTILKYANCSDEFATSFREHVYNYKDTVDKTASSDQLTTLRKKLTEEFFELYLKAFSKSLNEQEIPTIIKMFFLFGYVDEQLAGIENANQIFQLASHYQSDPANQIYTIYDWLVCIYKGTKDPSRNEFDVDYTQYLHELKLSEKITDAKQRQLTEDGMEKVRFELKNMFPIVNKITFGRITTYCPIFSEHNLLKEPEQIIVDTTKLRITLNQVREMDFSAFYRETVYFNTKLGVNKEFFHVEVLPDIILMPNVGTRGVMWQEIEGKKRSTPARFMLSILCLVDIPQIVTKLVAEYRWAMCKRVQGARWNDISEPSLTSEYCDYLQFYRKNYELSPDAKEKLKISLSKVKNIYRDLFILDYMTWILYEGQGSPRLNKVARKILFTYIPFKKEVCAKLGTNPLYVEVLTKHEFKKKQKLHHLNLISTKLSSQGVTIPIELQQELDFYEM